MGLLLFETWRWFSPIRVEMDIMDYSIKNATVFSMFWLVVFIGCEKNPMQDDSSDCLPVRPNIAASSFGWPVWSPDGKNIAFNHTPVKRIYRDPVDCLYYYEFHQDSAGFWMINADGRNQRRVLDFSLGEPDWSPDGQWITFDGQSAQIYKIRVVDGNFAMGSLTQLTTEGRNFFPSWSPDGQWIAYDSNLNNPSGGYSIWRMRNSGQDKQLLISGRMADWSEDGMQIFYIGLYNEIYRLNLLNFFAYRLTSFNQTDGSGLRQLTTEGANHGFSWNPDSKEIVYVSYRSTDYSVGNGTLWIINIESGAKRQLTFNRLP